MNERLERHHLHHEDHHQDHRAELELEPRDSDGSEQADERAHQDRDESHDRRVAQVGAEAAIGEDEGEVVPRELLRDQRLPTAGGLAVECAGDHPVHGEQREDQDRGDRDAESDPGAEPGARVHSSSSFMRERM